MTVVAGGWPSTGVTFRTTRGSFVISAEILQHVEATGDDYDLRRAYAKALPPEAVAYKRERLRDGSARVRWRIIRVVAR